MKITSLFGDFTRRTGGNVAIMVGLLFGTITVAAGGGIDATAAYNYRTDLQAVADRASLYGARAEDRKIADIEAFATEVLRAKYAGRNTFSVTVTREDGEIVVGINGQSKNHFLPVIGMPAMEIAVESRAMNVAGLVDNIEVALVLDTTESMADDMPELRRAALKMVEKLYEAGEERVKISVVPYTSTVNIGAANANMMWMDTNAGNAHHAKDIEGVTLHRCEAPPTTTSSTGSPGPAQCNLLCGCPGGVPCGGGDDGASVIQPKGIPGSPILKRILAALGPASAHAGSHAYPAPGPSECPFYSPDVINNFDLFDAIPNADWMGCVEARPAPYDISDNQPDTANPDTLFVPFLWYDDDGYWADEGHAWANDYLPDDTKIEPAVSPAFVPNWGDTKRGNVHKYDGVTMASVSETGPDIRGPNRSCPAPILPLQASRVSVEQSIDALTHRNGGGTIISEGLAWGWRTLSPGAPFSEGVAYDDKDVRKIIILLSDGANAVQKRGDDGTGSVVDKDVYGDFTAYGYARSFHDGYRGRGFIQNDGGAGQPYFEKVRGYLDERTRGVCSNIKAASEDNPIEIFTVLVGDHDQRTQAVMADCATSEVTHYKNAADMIALTEAFDSVAGEIIGSGQARITY